MAGVWRRNILHVMIRCNGERLQSREKRLWPFTNLSGLVHPHCLPSQHCASQFNRHKYTHTHTHTHVLLTVLMERYQNRKHYREPSWDFTSILDEWMRHIAMWQAVHSYYNHLSCIHWRTSSCCDGTSVVFSIFDSLHSYSSHVFFPFSLTLFIYLFIFGV